MIKKTIEKFIPKWVLGLYHWNLAFLAALAYGFASRKLTVIGVTGTKGKSSTVILIGKILEESGAKTAWFTSATIKVSDKEILNPYHMTMPGRFVIQKFLRDAVKAGCKYAVLEVTSEGIKQFRHKFINFDTAVFTNLKPEHIEAHGSFENYRNEKLKLFKATKKTHIINLDDENAGRFLAIPAEQKIGFTKNSDYQANNKLSIVNFFLANGQFKIQDTFFKLSLLGEFNVYNSVSAVCAGMAQGISLETCKNALEKIKTMPGRMEVILEHPFKVIVDLAHTPDSYIEIFKAVKSMPHNKIITVFGSAGGGRDKWKRPVMGKIASENSDYIILTNEDPYDENPSQILSEIKSGISNPLAGGHVCEVLDRREAIEKALKMAQNNDIVLILGKGTEQVMILKDKKIPWDDREITKQLLTEIK